jgi:hypothetical protein
MNLGGLTREQKLLGAAIANVLFVISIFLKWQGPDTPIGDFSLSGQDLDSWWIALVIALLAAAIFAADALRFELPSAAGIGVATYLTSLTLFYSLIWMFALDDRKYGLFLALIFSAAATALATAVWRQER